MRSVFDENGYALVERVFNAGQCEAIADRVSTASVVRAGSRNLLHDAWCLELARCLKGHAAIAAYLPVAAVGVQCTLFDKSSVKNWLVALHQDLSIPVRERITDPACTGWSEKEGVLFVQRIGPLSPQPIQRIRANDFERREARLVLGRLDRLHQTMVDQ